MGAKIHGRLKTRRPTCKCDVCGCGFLNVQALRSHQACVHPRTTKRVAYKPKIEVIARRKVVPAKKSMKTGNMKAKVVNVAGEKTLSAAKGSGDNKPYNTRRTEFECPVCAKIFTVYFSAYRHIQKHHCINEEGEPVPPNSTDLIQPTRIELCMTCNKRVASNQPHSCTAKLMEKEKGNEREKEDVETSYTCLGCEQMFTSLNLFEVHVPGLHSDELDSFCFPNVNTFTAWKENLESQTEMKYVLLSKKGHTQMYHCSHMVADENPSQLCPAGFTVHELRTGSLVTFYKEHFGHVSKDYIIPETYKTHHIIPNESECTVPSSKDSIEVYGLFKQVVSEVLTSSEKLDVNELKMLQGKALEMMAIIQNCNNSITRVEEEAPSSNKSITDDEITKLLDKPLKKRRFEGMEDSIAKRLRKERDSISQRADEPKIDDVKPDIPEIRTYANPRKPVTSKAEEIKKLDIQSPSSFNDSYKNFVDASYKSNLEKAKQKSKMEHKKKEIVKTKVGQFKPSISPKENVKPLITKDNLKLDNTLNDKSIFKDTVKEIKIRECNLPKPASEFEYEVKEQENDCNILIIKI